MLKTPNMIMSASGWRKIFTASGFANDSFPRIGNDNVTLCLLAADVFVDYVIQTTGNKNPIIVCGIDTRPTGPSIADAMLRMFLAKGAVPRYLGITAAPEIMACSARFNAFMYISASHNPIGYNGLKFGLNNGGVLEGSENAKIVQEFVKRWNNPDLVKNLSEKIKKCTPSELDWVYTNAVSAKKEASSYYHDFMIRVISDSNSLLEQKNIFSLLRLKSLQKKIDIVCDMNGSARSLSIDKDFFKECGIGFYAINNNPGQIVHGILPEGDNLAYCACEIERLQEAGQKSVVLGYMPDCDGDRGNIVYWDEKDKHAKVLKAQDVFALSVLSELAYDAWSYRNKKDYKPAVVVNGPTSMRIDEIAKLFGAKVFRAEVGEANVVNLAREKRAEGYTVRILGEGSNGGNITHPEAVRDPLNTIFALIRLMVLHSENETEPNLFATWCKLSGQDKLLKDGDFTLSDIISSLPHFQSTETQEDRAIMHIKTTDHSVLKQNFQKFFEADWEKKKDTLQEKYGIVSYEAISTNGLVETRNVSDYGISKKGGLKIIFYGKNKESIAYFWMRGSGTEPIFRVLCDVKGDDLEFENNLLQWERKLIEEADKI